MMRTTSFLAAAAMMAAISFAPTAGRSDESISLNGAGASFPFPLYSKWVSEYNKLDPRVKINYQSIGSGGGIKQFSDKTVDFGGTDAFMKDEALAALGVKVWHIPTTLGAVVVTYNSKDLPPKLNITPEVISGIFLGEIKKWNDPKIATANPGAKFPDAEINVVHRSDGSGTSAVFTDYLSKISPEWKAKAGSGTSVKWPAGLGAKGNEGVTGQVKSTPFSIGYVELAYALQNKLPVAVIKNRSGNLVEPKLDSISAAAAAVSMPEDFRVSITDAPGADAYPISAFTWILVYEDQKDRVKGETLAKFLWWAIHDGQKFGTALDYATLPAPVVTKVENALRKLKYEGKPLLNK